MQLQIIPFSSSGKYGFPSGGLWLLRKSKFQPLMKYEIIKQACRVLTRTHILVQTFEAANVTFCVITIGI